MGTARLVVEAEHDETPLFVRASPPRTFLGLGAFVEIGLLFCGSYLLIDSIARPLEASQTAVLAAALMLALALILLFYLFQPMRRAALAQRRKIRKVRRTPGKISIIRNFVHPPVATSHLLHEKRNLPGPM